jgi:hypothetical protein
MTHTITRRPKIDFWEPLEMFFAIIMRALHLPKIVRWEVMKLVPPIIERRQQAPTMRPLWQQLSTKDHHLPEMKNKRGNRSGKEI